MVLQGVGVLMVLMLANGWLGTIQPCQLVRHCTLHPVQQKRFETTCRGETICLKMNPSKR